MSWRLGVLAGTPTTAQLPFEDLAVATGAKTLIGVAERKSQRTWTFRAFRTSAAARLGQRAQFRHHRRQGRSAKTAATYISPAELAGTK